LEPADKGPIVRNKAHFFGSYEYEREPQTLTFSSRWPSFNISQGFKREELKALGRLDYELSRQTHLSVRYSKTDATQRPAARGWADCRCT